MDDRQVWLNIISRINKSQHNVLYTLVFDTTGWSLDGILCNILASKGPPFQNELVPVQEGFFLQSTTGPWFDEGFFLQSTWVCFHNGPGFFLRFGQGLFTTHIYMTSSEEANV